MVLLRGRRRSPSRDERWRAGTLVSTRVSQKPAEPGEDEPPPFELETEQDGIEPDAANGQRDLF